MVPDVWPKEAQRGKMSMLIVSPALHAGQLSYAVSLRGSNVDNLSSSFLTLSVRLNSYRQMEHIEVYPLLIRYINEDHFTTMVPIAQ